MTSIAGTGDTKPKGFTERLYVTSELAKDEARELPDEELRSREGVHQPVEDKIEHQHFLAD
jgi:hypothetical protein